MILKTIWFLAAVVVGGAVAVGTVMGAEYVGHQLYPPPDTTDPAAVARYVESAPIGSLFMVLFAWGGGALIGAIAATLVIGRSMIWPGVLVGSIITAAVVMNLYMIPHPQWMMFAGLALPIPLAALGSYVFLRR